MCEARERCSDPAARRQMGLGVLVATFLAAWMVLPCSALEVEVIRYEGFEQPEPTLGAAAALQLSRVYYKESDLPPATGLWHSVVPLGTCSWAEPEEESKERPKVVWIAAGEARVESGVDLYLDPASLAPESGWIGVMPAAIRLAGSGEATESPRPLLLKLERAADGPGSWVAGLAAGSGAATAVEYTERAFETGAGWITVRQVVGPGEAGWTFSLQLLDRQGLDLVEPIVVEGVAIEEAAAGDGVEVALSTQLCGSGLEQLPADNALWLRRERAPDLRPAIQVYYDQLSALPASGDPDLDARLSEAIDLLWDQLTPHLWLDDRHLSFAGGMVFYKQPAMVTTLESTLAPENPWFARRLSRATLDWLMVFDQELAAAALAHSGLLVEGAHCGRGGDPKICKKVLREVEKGASKLERAIKSAEAALYQDAVDRFSKAWDTAQLIQNLLSPGDVAEVEDAIQRVALALVDEECPEGVPVEELGPHCDTARREIYRAREYYQLMLEAEASGDFEEMEKMSEKARQHATKVVAKLYDGREEPTTPAADDLEGEEGASGGAGGNGTKNEGGV